MVAGNIVSVTTFDQFDDLGLLARARNAQEEDVFLHGPDIYGALNKKVDLMRAHGLDGQRYLSPARK